MDTRNGGTINKILLTGFEPFGGEEVNPSLEAIKKLDGYRYKDYNIIGLEVPTVYKESMEVIEEKISSVEPKAVISVGQAGGRNRISVERIGTNVDDTKQEDNEGNKPKNRPIDKNGHDGYFSTLPIQEITDNLKEKDIPAKISNSAGTYICNHIMYGVLNHIKRNDLKMKSGFIHVPYLPEQVLDKNKPSMSMDMITEAIEITVRTTVDSLE